MSKPTETEILSAIKTLQAALVNKWGDEALSAGDGEGCSIDIRFGGVALVEPKCDCNSSTPRPRLSRPIWPSLPTRGYYRDGTRSADDACRALAVSFAIER